MLTHRAFRVPAWLEYILAIIGVLSAQGSPLLWVAGHRIHHRYADTDSDPHTPRKGFFFSHIGHLMVQGTHTWGYRNFETGDASRNCWWVALLAAGEGWHNAPA